MQLTSAQLAQYRRDGVIHFTDLFSAAEVAAFKAEQARIMAMPLDSHLRAQTGEFLGTTAMERVSPLYARLLRDERLLGIAEQLLGPALYCHQYKIILKEPFGKLSLPWHQDYGPWLHHDGMPQPTAISIGIYLDEITEFNGPIVYMPGSHAQGPIEYEVIPVPGTTPIPSLPNATVVRLTAEHGMISPKGPAGSVTIFDCCTAHASGQNLSPYPRNLIYLSYNPVANHITKQTRPTHFANQDFTPLTQAPRAALLEAVGA